MIDRAESGWSGTGTYKEKLAGEIAVLKVSAVTKGYFIPKECKVLNDQQNIKKYVYPEKGDLIFSRANTREMVGSTAVIEDDYTEHILPDKLWKIKVNNMANVYYLKGVLSTPNIRGVMSSLSTGTSGSMYNLSFEKFKEIKIMLPPIEMQSKFADFVRQIAKSKVVEVKYR